MTYTNNESLKLQAEQMSGLIVNKVVKSSASALFRLLSQKQDELLKQEINDLPDELKSVFDLYLSNGFEPFFALQEAKAQKMLNDLNAEYKFLVDKYLTQNMQPTSIMKQVQAYLTIMEFSDNYKEYALMHFEKGILPTQILLDFELMNNNINDLRE